MSCLAYISVLSCAVQSVFLVPLLSQASLHQQSWLLPDDKTAARDDVVPKLLYLSFIENKNKA